MHHFLCVTTESSSNCYVFGYRVHSRTQINKMMRSLENIKIKQNVARLFIKEKVIDAWCGLNHFVVMTENGFISIGDKQFEINIKENNSKFIDNLNEMI